MPNPSETVPTQPDGTVDVEEKTATASPDTAYTPSQEPDGTVDVDWKARFDEAVAQSRKWEARAKENFKAAKERDALAERLKGSDTTVEELRAQVADFEHDRQVSAWRQEAASEHGVPADLLSGDTLEQVREQAERLAAWRDSLAPSSPSGPGLVRHAGNPEQSGPVTVAQQIAQAQASGDKQLVASLKALQLTQAPKQ